MFLIITVITCWCGVVKGDVQKRSQGRPWYLCLQGVEVGEGVHRLVGGVVQGREGQGVQVQQLCVGWVPLWQNQVLERHCQEGLCSKPRV